MATSVEYVEFVCDQLRGVGELRWRKMFGEYMIYVNEKPILLVCDNTVFVKKLPELAGRMAEAGTGIPYQGSAEHYILDVEDREAARETVALLERLTPPPKPKKPRKKKLSS